LSYAEVAGAMGLPVGSIGPTRSRCLARLRRELAIEGITDFEE
jgi:DNA-directed RNA polymerase specialized sigma24 family protein